MINSTDFSLDFNSASLDAISLTPEQIKQAAQLGIKVNESPKQWQLYLNHLALLGFESWLQQRLPELTLDTCDVKYILNGIYQLKIGQFKVCLLTQGTLDDQVVSLPPTAIDLDKSHFYILVTVDEEHEQVLIEGIIRYDQIKQCQSQQNLILQSDQTYHLPLDLFDFDINHLLLYLRCLEPTGIHLENTEIHPQISLISGMNFTPTLQPVINIGSWLQNQLDAVAEGLSWLLLPSPQFVMEGFRSLSTLDTLLDRLQYQNLLIPADHQRASLDFNLGDIPLKLYAIPGLVDNSNEWSLLFILGTSDEQPLPEGLKLQIQESSELLNEQEICPDQIQSYLYSQVIGEPYEQFTLTITLKNGEVFSLPPFTFIP